MTGNKNEERWAFISCLLAPRSRDLEDITAGRTDGENGDLNLGTRPVSRFRNFSRSEGRVSRVWSNLSGAIKVLRPPFRLFLASSRVHRTL